MQYLVRAFRVTAPKMAVPKPATAVSSALKNQNPHPILYDPYDALDAVLENMRLSSEPVEGIKMQLLGRNSRKPKKANHGKRPCSHVRRRSKRLR